MAYQGKTEALETSLNSEIPYLIDVDGKAPFDYCLKTKNIRGINLIITKLCQEGTYMDHDAFYHAMTHSGVATKRLLDKTLFLPSQASGKLELPLIGHLHKSAYARGDNRQEMFTDETRNISMHSIQKYVDVDHSEQKIIQCEASRIALNLTAGSNESLYFLRMVQEADNDALYSSPLSHFIDYKWQKQWWLILLYSSIYFTYFVVHSVFIADKWDDHTFVQGILYFNVGLLLFEIYQSICVGAVIHFMEIWNWFDLIGNLCMITWCSRHLDTNH